MLANKGMRLPNRRDSDAHLSVRGVSVERMRPANLAFTHNYLPHA